MAREWLEEDSIVKEWPKHYPDVKFPITDEMVRKLHQRCPSALYNGQLKPLIGYALRGAIWYQGEDNVPRHSYYAKLLKRMVEGWRADWQLGDFPFYFCQIAPYDYSLIQWEGKPVLARTAVVGREDYSQQPNGLPDGCRTGVWYSSAKKAGSRRTPWPAGFGQYLRYKRTTRFCHLRQCGISE